MKINPAVRRIIVAFICLLFSPFCSLHAIAADESIPCTNEPTDMSIDYGITINCSIDVVGDSDLFRLDGQENEVVLLQIADGNGSNPFPMVNVEVIDPNGATVTSTTSRTKIMLSMTGLYTFKVSELQADQVTGYNIAVERLAPAPTIGAIPICFGCTESDTVNPFGDMDMYSFDGSSGDVVSISISDGNGSNPFPVVQIDVYDPIGDLVGSSTSQVDATLNDTGKYTIVVYERDRDQTLSYDLTLQCLAGSCLSPDSLIISPASGDYVTTQSFDLTLIVKAPGLSVVGGSATLDGSDVTAFLAGCVIEGTLISGGQTFRCENITGGILNTGPHTFCVTLDLSNGYSVNDCVAWAVNENTEP